MDLKQVVVILGFVCFSYADENYCDPSLCEDGLTHTACDHYLEFASECGEDPEVVPMTVIHKKLIIDLHNQHRNKLAQGKLPGYAPAARMPAMRWNEDLAYIASLHSRSCTEENDRCRNTRHFKNVGQNIGVDMVGEPIYNVTGIMKRIIEAWHSEYKLGNQNNIKQLSTETIETMGRFTMMMNDRSSDVGCAMVKFFKDDLYNAYFTCNYASTNHLDQKVYETGTSCSNCLSGCNKIWTALCSADEKIDPNHHHIETLRSYN